MKILNVPVDEASQVTEAYMHTNENIYKLTQRTNNYDCLLTAYLTDST